MADISIIIPVYNVHDYLALTLDSVISQTHRDIEIVCVNDGSTDDSLAVLDIYSKLDDRIVIIDKENGGLSSARNAGIRAASSPIICFLDSDDLLAEDACSIIIDAFKKTNADIVTYGGVPYPEFRGYPWLDSVLSPRPAVYVGFDMAILTKENSHPFVWRTALTRRFIERNNLYFDEDLKYGEDQLFHFSIYPRSSKTVFIPNKLVKYRVSRSGSLMDEGKSVRENLLKKHLRIVSHIISDWKSGGFLSNYESDLLLWILDFVAFDIAKLDPPARIALAYDLCEMIKTEFTPTVIKECLSEKRAPATLLSFILSISDASSPDNGADVKRKIMLVRYYIFRHGKKAAIGRALARFRELITHIPILEGVFSDNSSQVSEEEWDRWDAERRLSALRNAQDRVNALKQSVQQ